MNPEKVIAIQNARRLSRQSTHGVLSTHSQSNDGYPFGSVTTFISTHEGDVVFYISDLAQHTKNLKADPKMSLTLFNHADVNSREIEQDPNANARLTLLGDAAPLSSNDDDYDDIRRRFFRLHPKSRSYESAHDFAFYKMTVSRARFIGGFGDIHWISGQTWHLNTPEWKDGEEKMTTHMNEDHEDAMRLICSHYASLSGSNIEMLAVDPDGGHYLVDKKHLVFVPFEDICLSSQSVRKALVHQTNTARAASQQNSS